MTCGGCLEGSDFPPPRWRGFVYGTSRPASVPYHQKLPWHLCLCLLRLHFVILRHLFCLSKVRNVISTPTRSRGSWKLSWSGGTESNGQDNCLIHMKCLNKSNIRSLSPDNNIFWNHSRVKTKLLRETAANSGSPDPGDRAFTDQTGHHMFCPHECDSLQEHMKAASHLQRARIICLFLHLCL